jgi:hypothetical protein
MTDERTPPSSWIELAAETMASVLASGAKLPLVVEEGANGSIVIMELEKHPALHPARWNSAQWAAYEKSMVVADAINLAVEKAKDETPRQHSAREKVRLYLHTYLDLQYDTGMTVRELAKEVVKRNRRMGCVAPSDGLLVTIAEALDEFSL